MPRITTILVAALAASTLAVSTAAADPSGRVDRFDSPTSSLAGTVEKQDLRGEHAQDAARFNGRVPQPPVYWSYAYQAPKPQPHPVSAPTHKPTGDDVDVWLIVAIALGASGLLAGTALLVTRHSRVRAAA